MNFTAGRRALLSAMFGVAAAAAVSGFAPDTRASVSVGASLLDLTRESSSVAIVTPLESRAEWQGRRIVTYHRVRIESLIAGGEPGSEIVVRTLGGRVGAVTQAVEGEPVFEVGSRSLLFLKARKTDAWRVSARAQGQFRVSAGSDGRAVVFRAARLGLLVARDRTPKLPADAAVLTLHGASLETAAERVIAAWRQTHAH